MNKIIDRFIFEEYATSLSALGLYRILYSAYILLVFLPQYLWLSRVPDSFLSPPIGFTALFNRGLPPPAFFLAVNGLAILAALSLLIGYRSKVSATCLALLLLLGNSWQYSFGKINHDILLIVVPLIMQFAQWGAAYSVDGYGRQVSPKFVAWPMALLALTTAFLMLTAAVPKVASGWLDPHSHAVEAKILYNHFVLGRETWLSERLVNVKSGVFWEFQDYATVLLEAAFVLALGRRTAFRLVCAIACFFHLGTAFSMGITFVVNILAYAAFCDWSVLERRPGVQRVLKIWNRMLERVSGWSVLAAGAIITSFYLGLGNPLQMLAARFPPEPDPIDAALSGVAATVAAVFLYRFFRNCGRGRDSRC